MATYTVIQDIEAEDKLLGPLSMRQFIYAIIVIAFGFMAFTLGKISPFLAIPFLLPMGFFGLLAAPFGRDQSSETWLLAKIRFMFKPRRRVWDQSGLKQLVTITVPKKVEKHLTDGLDQMQVKSRLSALANTLDSRGWAVKNVATNIYTPPLYAAPGDTSDRLVAANTIPQAVPTDDIRTADDILDEQNNPTAQKFESLITQSEQSRRQNLIATMHEARAAQVATPPQQQPAEVAVAPQPQPVQFVPAATAPPAPVLSAAPVAPTPTLAPAAQLTPQQPDITDEQFLEQIRKNKADQRASNSHIRRIPTSEERAAEEAAAVAQKAEAMAAEAERAKELQRLAANDDLNVATIAREAQRETDNQLQVIDGGEVVVSLH